MPVRVEVLQARVLRLQGEIRAIDHLARRVQARDRCDAGVDDRDVDSLTGVAGVPPRLHAVAGSDALHRVRVARRVIRRGSAPRGARVDPAEQHRQHEGEKTHLPGLEARSVARCEGCPHVYLLVATALMPQRRAAVAAKSVAGT